MYAIIRRYRDNGYPEIKDELRELIPSYVHFGFADRRQAETWNEEHFPSPEYNLIVPCSEFGE